MYSPLKSALEEIVEWLRSDDTSHWERQTASLYSLCSETERLSQPSVDSPDTPKMRNDTPDLIWKMLSYMKDRKRDAALEIGGRVLSELSLTKPQSEVPINHIHYWRVGTATGERSHYAPDREGEPEKHTLCGRRWTIKHSPVIGGFPVDCARCQILVSERIRQRQPVSPS